MNARKYMSGAILALAVVIPFRADAGTLRGSPSSMEQQHEIAVDEDLTFMRKASQVQHLVDSGGLVTVEGNEDFALAGVSFPYARPEVLLFIQRLSAQYHADNGVKLIVTSLTRPADLQPRNAHKLSVHPAGMAVDFRIPSTAKERAWLEKALLGMENASVLDVTRERNPPHYHVAVFPAEYLAYAKEHETDEPAKPVIDMNSIQVLPAAATTPEPAAHSVNSSGGHTGALIVASLITLLLVVGAGAQRFSSSIVKPDP